MSYDLHITRDPDWMESEQSPITREEWNHVVEADEYLQTHEDDFTWSQGRITIRNPEEVDVAQCVRIAKQMGAVVHGDDGEMYG